MPRYDDDDDEDRDEGRRRRRYGDDEYDVPRRALPHSGLGITSCVVAGLSLLLGFVAMAIVMASGLEDNFDTAVEQGDPHALLAAFLFIGSGFLCLTGAIVGAAGLAQQRNKLFAILGLCLNGFLLLCGLGLMALGAAVSN